MPIRASFFVRVYESRFAVSVDEEGDCDEDGLKDRRVVEAVRGYDEINRLQ